jgi:prepilin-type N-terminal cleavage/methylation domain-containing protein
MSAQFKSRLLQHLANKKNNGGFTLIELLVVVIIIGVLAAVALPNLLNQVGKARETEGKNGVGTVNRAQQSYHFEKGSFAPALANADLQANNALGVIIPASKYYTFATSAGDADAVDITAGALDATSAEDNGEAQGVREYSGGTYFTASSGAYDQILCQATAVGEAVAAPTDGDNCSAGEELK